jgi:hypothetical protein
MVAKCKMSELEWKEGTSAQEGVMVMGDGYK